MFWYKLGFGPLGLEDLVFGNVLVHPDAFKLQCHLSVTILMQCPVIVSMLIRTRMSSICLQIGILLVCSWGLWGVSFNPSDLNARSKLRTPNSFKMVYFWCPIDTTGELKIQLLMILVLNFSTLRLVSYDRKEEKHCLVNSCFTCVSMSWNRPFLLSSFFFPPGDASKQFSVSLQFGGGDPSRVFVLLELYLGSSIRYQVFSVLCREKNWQSNYADF